MQTELYFAYGSNLNATNWQERTGMPFKQAFEIISTAYLPDAKLAFTRRTINGGVLDVVHLPGSIAAGAVYRIKNQTAREILDRKEGEPFCYRKVERVVFTAAGQQIPVFTYKAIEQAEYIKPHPDYVKVVADGLRSLGLATYCLLAAAKNKPQPSMLTKFFCYGTLRKGECRYKIMQELGIVSNKSGFVKGTLYDCGSYPAAILGNAGTRKHIIGEVIHVRNIADGIRRLDCIEGFCGFGEAGSLYNRRIVPVKLQDGKTVPAWIYEYNRSIENLKQIKSGDWTAM